MSSVVVDTHAAVWFRTAPERLSVAATVALDEADADGEIYVSAITLVELRYLVEKGRLAPDILKGIEGAIDDPATAFTHMPVDRAVADAMAHVARADVRLCLKSQVCAHIMDKQESFAPISCGRWVLFGQSPDVPDMPDRIIAATAYKLGLPLVTRDGKIRASGVLTIW